MYVCVLCSSDCVYCMCVLTVDECAVFERLCVLYVCANCGCVCCVWMCQCECVNPPPTTYSRESMEYKHPRVHHLRHLSPTEEGSTN